MNNKSDDRLATLVNPDNIDIYLIQPLILVPMSLVFERKMDAECRALPHLPAWVEPVEP